MQSRTTPIPSNAWFKSSYSGANTSECVETAFLPGGPAVRDSKDRHGPQLAFGAPAWAGFVAALRNGQLD
ncbi:DUF397 domain-containing protein [Streptomyces sp. NPDC051320]|uniref:DUF397 domain-containing protein n=1 Tax=Streptomyces sp. NPDC051320 TaxID=3154644 RepID=UPI003443D74B